MQHSLLYILCFIKYLLGKITKETIFWHHLLLLRIMKRKRVIPAVKHPPTLSYWSFYDNWVSQHIIWAAWICLCIYICPFSYCACINVEMTYNGHIVHLTSISTHTENRDQSKILDRIISAVRSSFIPKFQSLNGEFDYFTCSVYQFPLDSQYNKSYCSLLSLWAAAVTAWTIVLNYTHVRIHPKGPILHPLSMDICIFIILVTVPLRTTNGRRKQDSPSPSCVRYSPKLE